FQAEDGIRDKLVTGVQTCALPIFAGTGAGAGRWLAGFEFRPGNGLGRPRDGRSAPGERPGGPAAGRLVGGRRFRQLRRLRSTVRSEERRVGKEGRARWWPSRVKKK